MEVSVETLHMTDVQIHDSTIITIWSHALHCTETHICMKHTHVHGVTHNLNMKHTHASIHIQTQQYHGVGPHGPFNTIYDAHVS